MAFQLSPGINVSEIDLTTVVPAVATTEGAIAGVFRWGPINERILVSSEIELVNRFGKPTNNNAETFFSAANFLSYSDALYVTRVVSDSASIASSTIFEAAYPGELGNSIEVGYCDSASFAETQRADTLELEPSATSGVITTSANTGPDYLSVGDVVLVNDQALVVSTVGTPSEANTVFETTVTFANRYIGIETYQSDFKTQWGYASAFDSAPSSGSVHVVAIDKDGGITGVAGSVLEVYSNLSLTAGARRYDGTSNYIDTVLELSSSFIRSKATSGMSGSGYENFSGGLDGDSESAISIGKLVAGYDLYQTSEVIDVSFIIQGATRGNVLANYLIDNIADKRKDCIVFITPDVTPGTYNAQDLVTAVSTLRASSYAVVDSGYKYQYDKYNDVYRWVPMNGDIAGLCARTDDIRDPWFSPAGYSRGGIKNVVKLSLNPSRAERDLMYKNGINPVIVQPGQGTILFGDKTFLNQPSAFDRINVRRLFIVLEKAIAISAKATLFEFNDEFTRAQFKNLVEPYLRDVQGRRGIYDFKVVCDTTNNTPDIIDRNEFVGDIYVKPARSINFIQLNFVAVRTGVEFSEIVGQ